MGFFITSGKSYTSMVIVAESDQYEATSEYVAAIGQTSSTTPSPTSLAPSPTVPEFPVTIVIAFLIFAVLIVSVAVKKNSAKLPILS